ncbi:MAG: 2OG-Fe(II) oxygenase, partial [Gammaproteobacteria bacterium]|nr:2OG-Fe(II) oxygenase [Gammaproteobacteria bacterium]
MSGDHLSNWLRWRSGRQASGYEKMLLLMNPFLVPFDFYLLRFREGAEVPEHTDPVTDKKHYRLNIV